MSTQQEAYEMWRREIADELERADANRTEGDKWVLEAGFWVGLIAFLIVVWILVMTLVMWG